MKIVAKVIALAAVGLSALCVGSKIFSNESTNSYSEVIANNSDVIRLMGGHICQPNKWFFLDNLNMAGLFVDNAERPCSFWRIPSDQRYVIATYLDVSPNKIPIVIYGKPNIGGVSNTRLIKTIFVEVVGGPSGSIAPMQKGSIVAGLASDDTIAVSIGYTGTMYGSMFPKPSLEFASLDVANYILALKRNIGEKVNIALMGESLGGRIAVSSFAKLADKKVRVSLFLVSPLLFSPNEAEKNFKYNLGNNASNDSVINTRLLSQKDQPWQNIPSAKLFHSFFEDRARDIKSASVIEKYNKSQVYIIFGSQDKTIGINNVAGLGLNRNNIFEIDGMAHHPSESDVEYIQSIIKKKANDYMLDGQLKG